MRNQPNIQVLQSDKRFQALVKNQEMEHQHLISNHHKEMQELRDALNLSMEKFKSLSEINEKEMKELKNNILCTLGILGEKVMGNEFKISEQRSKSESLSMEMLIFQSLYCSKNDLDEFKKEVKKQISEIVTGNINGFQECQSHLKDLLNSLRDDLINAKEGTAKKISELIDQIEKNYNILKIDREGILKEIRVWEKTIFIIEKKIENIYTLIERINNRGESCHKPE
jgi:hypothetical protein